jgi:hypothetical protein
MLAVVLSLVCLHVLGILAMIHAARNAPCGFEDEGGFHAIATPPPDDGVVFIPQMPFEGISARTATSHECASAQDRSLRSIHRACNTFRAFVSRRKIDGAR